MTEDANMELLKRLDRQNRYLKGIALISAALSTYLILYGSPFKTSKDVIVGKEFILVDENDVPRAVLRNSLNGPIFSMADEKGNLRIELSATSDSGKMLLFNSLNKPKIGLLTEGETSKLSFADDKGYGLAGFVVNQKDANLLFGRKGEPRIGIGISKDGPSIEVVDHRNTLRAKMWYDLKKPRFVLLDEKEKPLWTAP